MARDETARECDPEQSLLDRRSHRRLAGAAAATVAGATLESGSCDRRRDAERREGRDGDE